MSQNTFERPNLSFWQIWNMCFGFLGIQFGFALQSSNMSRIFQSLGAEMDQIPLLWIAAPITGLIVQPIVGYFSDRTWTGLGRRRPYFLYGAIATSIALIFMPNSPTLWIAAGMLWILDASINVSMEPFRAFVGDQLNEKQRPTGYAMQSFFIGIGAVVASMLPWIFANWFGVSNSAVDGGLPDSVTYSFYAGAVVLFLAVGWTVLKSKEYTPEELARFDGIDEEAEANEPGLASAKFAKLGAIYLAVGAVLTAVVNVQDADQQLYILSIGLMVFGVVQLIVAKIKSSKGELPGLWRVFDDLYMMPSTMKQLAVVQFFSWFGLFAMWIYTTAAVTSFHFGTTDTSSDAYNEGANWVGVLFASYNAFSVVAAMLIPVFIRFIGIRLSHSVNLLLGAAGFASFLVIENADYLIISMVGIGFAWASILSLPYAMLSNSIKANKMGTYMGIFNFFIVLPQILAATILGLLVKYLFNNEPIYALLIGAISFVIAALSVAFVKPVQKQ
ncbi:MFS transporter [Paraferrimonas sp. SM1919]|uniref:MFS transporter n=1 Tax=Paraferrimonas sp. SM1919 TaxID=2662263 RepID=UPI0013D6253F|nr:MFS transporter [Paraferrimonas sp. SM1919]